MKRTVIAGLAFLAACRAGSSEKGDLPIAAWRLVEVASPGGPQLVMEADPYPGVTAPEGVEVRLSRGRAGVGERVEVEAWRPDAAGRYWLEIWPTRPGVRILGPRALLLDGPERALFGFTCDTGGRGGVALVVRE